VDALPHEHSNLEVDTLTDSKPVELSQDRSDVFSTGRAANQTSSGVLDGLEALQVDISHTSQQRVAVVQPEVDKRLYQCTNSVRGER